MMLSFLGLFVFAAIRLAPLYLNYFSVIGVINGVQKEYDGQNPTRTALRTSIARRFDIENIALVRARDVKVTVVSGGYAVGIVYDHRTPFIANVSFDVHFDKKVEVRR